tara:strand:- start:622 stop:1404 length:783 start_codon:yes stop_codon:yes gene_type:complete
MKVDVYPNITNVEVYENPISIPVDASWEKMVFTVPDPVVNTFTLNHEPMVDRDGDFVLTVTFNSVMADYGDDYTLDGKVITWVSNIALEAGEELVVWYSPKQLYGSVPGASEVSSLNHLTDVTIAGPTEGQILIRNNSNNFVNANLTAGDDISITSGSGTITITSTASAVLPLAINTVDINVVVNNAYLFQTNSASLTATLPVTAQRGDTIEISRFGLENVTVARNGHKINGQDSDYVLSSDLTHKTFRYADANIGWFTG